MTDASGDLGHLPIHAVYFGGGTPTDLAPSDFEAILGCLRRRYRIVNDCEITVEGRVVGFSEDKIRACVDHGVNRFSIGVQTFDTGLRRMLGRIADRREVVSFLNMLASCGQAAVVADLLYGIPGQTLENWLEDQRIVLETLDVSGIDHYRFNIHPGLPLAKSIEKGLIPAAPDESAIYEMYRMGEDVMRDAGAIRLSIKHYALTYRERNANNDISGRKCPCLPFGIHASGRMGNFVFHQTDDLNTYREMVQSGRKPLDRAGRMPPDYPVCCELIGQIARKRGINVRLAAQADSERSASIVEAVGPVLRAWEAEGLISDGLFGWKRLSSRAMFRHREIAPDLLEAVAGAY
jgi:oxygen-independent coproporphyrinogen-3 oxidase